MITFTGARHTPIYYLSKKTDDKITKKEDHATKSNLSGMIKTLRAPKRKGFPIGYVYERGPSYSSDKVDIKSYHIRPPVDEEQVSLPQRLYWQCISKKPGSRDIPDPVYVEYLVKHKKGTADNPNGAYLYTVTYDKYDGIVDRYFEPMANDGVFKKLEGNIVTKKDFNSKCEEILGKFGIKL